MEKMKEKEDEQEKRTTKQESEKKIDMTKNEIEKLNI